MFFSRLWISIELLFCAPHKAACVNLKYEQIDIDLQVESKQIVDIL
jgi:hypothetical protein